MSDVSSSESAEDLISKANLLEETRRSLRNEREGLVEQAKEKRASVSVTREKSDSRRVRFTLFTLPAYNASDSMKMIFITHTHTHT